MTSEEWEGMCDGCGKCCTLSPHPFACPALDCETNRCTKYDTRLETEMCLKVTPHNTLDLNRTGVLPDSCAYVRHAKGLPKLDSPEPARHAPLIVAPLEIVATFYKTREDFLARYRPAALARRPPSE